jgi:hypothetical protein
MRFDIDMKKHRRHHDIAVWMNQNIGPIEEGVTWFWSTRDYKEYNPNTNQLEDKATEGIEIWKDCPANTLAVLKFS